jgi:plasmid stabilization system protein ParE
MPVTYRILLSRQVTGDLQGIFEHIAAQSPQNANAVIDRILSAIEGLKTFPHRTIIQGRNTKRPVRSLPIQSWIVFCRVEDDQQVVRILRVRHGSRRRPRFE